MEVWPDSEDFLHAERDDKLPLYPNTSILNNTNQYLSKYEVCCQASSTFSKTKQARRENCKLLSLERQQMRELQL